MTSQALQQLAMKWRERADDEYNVYWRARQKIQPQARIALGLDEPPQ